MAHRTIRSTPPTAVAFLLVLAGCGTSPVQPHQDLARAEAAIEQAEQTGARRYGAEELDSAKAKLTRANAAVAEDDMLTAERYAEQAALDADLAAAKARSERSKLAVKELEDSIEVLRDEIARNQMRQGDTG